MTPLTHAIQMAFEQVATAHASKLQAPSNVTEKSIDAFAHQLLASNLNERDMDILYGLPHTLQKICEEEGALDENHIVLIAKVKQLIQQIHLHHVLGSAIEEPAINPDIQVHAPTDTRMTNLTETLPEELIDATIEMMRLQDMGRLSQVSPYYRLRVAEVLTHIACLLAEKLTDLHEPMLEELYDFANELATYPQESIVDLSQQKQAIDQRSAKVLEIFKNLFARSYLPPELRLVDIVPYFTQIAQSIDRHREKKEGSSYPETFEKPSLEGYMSALRHQSFHGFVTSLYSEFLDDRLFMKCLIEQDGLNLLFAPKAFRKDPELVKLAIQQHGLALLYADLSFQKDPQLIALAAHSCLDKITLEDLRVLVDDTSLGPYKTRLVEAIVYEIAKKLEGIDDPRLEDLTTFAHHHELQLNQPKSASTLLESLFFQTVDWEEEESAHRTQLTEVLTQMSQALI